MPKILLLATALTIFFACNLPQDQEFLASREEFNANLKSDDTFKVLDAAHFKKEQAKFQEWNETLKKFEMDRLPLPCQILLKSDRRQVQEKLWRVETFKIQEWNPTQYNLVEQIEEVFYDKSNPKQAETLLSILKQVPAYYEAAKQNIKQPTRFHTKLAIQQQESAYSFFVNEVNDFLAKADLDKKSKSAFQFYQQKSTLAIKDFLGFLNSTINNADDGGTMEVLSTLEEKQELFLEQYQVQNDSIDWVNFEIIEF